MKKYISIITSLIVIIGATIGAYEYFAHRSDVNAIAADLNKKISFLNIRIDNKIITDIHRDMKRDIDDLKTKYKIKECIDIPDDYDKDRCRRLEFQLKDIEKRIDILRNKYIEGEYN